MKDVVICIPMYNAELTISRTLDSLIEQDYPVKKIKIFDNVSTDKSRNVVSEYVNKHSQIELIINETNVGAEGNFTKCLQAAEGDYTVLAHSDDIYEKNFISKSVAVLESTPNAVASFCGALEINDNEDIIGERFMPSELNKKAITSLNKKDLYSLIFKYSNFITCPGVMVKSSAYRDEIKTWNGKQFNTSADLDVWLRLIELGNFVAIKDKLIKYRVGSASYSFRVAKLRTTKHDLFLVLDQHTQHLSAEDKENYHFLHLKDQAIRSLNLIRNKKRDVEFPTDVSFDLFLILEKMFHSKWHFKMGISIIGIKIISKILKWSRQCRK
jgi:glycosyltransferase involved in cell wall biosynthesis